MGAGRRVGALPAARAGLDRGASASMPAAAAIPMALTRGAGLTDWAMVSMIRTRCRSRSGPSLAGENGQKARTLAATSATPE